MDDSRVPGGSTWSGFEDAIRRFEVAWQQTARPDIDAFVAVGEPEGARLLMELVHVDLEYRLRAGESARVEEYLARYPALADNRDALLGLIIAEYELRRRRDPRLTVTDYIQRFPHFRGDLPEKIAAATIVDGSIRDTRTPENAPVVVGYEVLNPLGRGGMGVVYKARQLSLNRLVALKFLPEDCARDPVWLDRFRREALTASALNHPHICTIYDTGESAGRPFLSMELIDGRTLAELVGASPSIDDLTRLIQHAARALAAAHAAGVVHRDIKPQNLMARADGIVKVLDFGLARRLPGVDAANPMSDPDPGRRVGTAMYMSPEQARGDPAGTASDIFSLGIVLYELATGQHPFSSLTETAVLQSIIERFPLPISRLRPEIPDALDALVQHMMAKDPALRPTAAEVEASLAELTGPGFGRSSGQPIGRGRPITVGRETELNALRSAFESAASGRGLVLCVTGEPGLGKTTLVENFLAELATSELIHALARGRCSERLAGAEAYLPFLEALDSLIQGDGGAVAAHVMKVVAPTWYVQLTPLAAEDQSLARVLEEAKGASQERRKRELGVFFYEMSRRRPMVVFLDDVHWADPSSVDLLAYLGSKCAELRLLLILTYRPSDLVLTRHEFGPVKLDLQGRGVCREVALPFLSRDDLNRYLALAFAAHEFPEGLADVLHAKTEGNPLFMVDLLRYLRDRGVIVPVNDHWTLGQALPDLQRELPESVRGMVQRKVDQLSAADRHLLMAASVQGPEFDSAVLAEVLGQEAVDVEERLEILERVHVMVRLVREHPFPDRTLTLRYGFVHVLYQNALYAALQPTRKAAWSGAMASALLHHYGDKSSGIAAELAMLFEAARDPERAADYYLISAKNAARIFAHHEAVALARRGLAQLETLPDTPDRARRELPLHVTLGIQLQVVQGYAAPEAERTYDRARALCERVQDAEPLFLVLWGLWMSYEVGSNLEKSRELGDRLFTLAQKSQDSNQLIQAHMALAVTTFSLGDLAATRDHSEKSAALYDPKVHSGHAHLYGQDPKVASLAFGAVALWLLGYPKQAGERSREAVALGKESGHPTTRALALYFATMLRQYCREAPAVQEGAAATTAIATEHGLSLWLANGLVMGGWARAMQGDFASGIAMLRQGIGDWAATGAETHRTYFLGLLAEALGEGGQFEQGLAVLNDALNLMNSTGTVFYAAELHRLRGEFLLRCDSADGASLEAEACYRQALAVARRQQAKSLELRAALSLSRLAQAQGRAAEIQPILADVYGRFTEGFDTPDLRTAKRFLDMPA